MTVTAQHPPHVEQHIQHLEDAPRETLVEFAGTAARCHDRHAKTDYLELLHAIPRARPAAEVICPACGGVVNPTTSECRCSA